MQRSVFTKSCGDKPTDQTISLAEVRAMFGLPPASVLELPDPEEGGRSVLLRALDAKRFGLFQALLDAGAPADGGAKRAAPARAGEMDEGRA